MKVYKGTDKDMKCREFQYALGETVKDDGAIRCGGKGFHSCEAPLDVLRYYPMRDGNRYFVAEADGVIDRAKDEDSKIASSELTLKTEISVKDLIKAHFEFTRKKAETGTTGGNWSNLAGGDRSNLAGGYWSNLAGGDSSNLAGGNECKCKAGLDSVITFTQREWVGDKYKLTAHKTIVIDGETYKPDTWYKLENGEVVEVE